MELQIIQNKIHEIRGYKVILDFDLAEMYEVETRRLNESVKRNFKRFPPDFIFQLTKNEWEILMSQFATSRWGGTRKLPFAFTEQGVAMLSGLLNSDVAINVNISIMRAFVLIRQMVLNYQPANEIQEIKDRLLKLEIELKNNSEINEATRTQIEYIYNILGELQKTQKQLESPRNPIGFKINEVTKN